LKRQLGTVSTSPNESSSSLTLISEFSNKSTKITLAPSFRNLSAVTLPMPPAPPVITATFPDSLSLMLQPPIIIFILIIFLKIT